MVDVLITSRSFGEFATAGSGILARARLSAYRPGPDERPLTEERLRDLVSRSEPRAIVTGTDPITSAVLAASDRLCLVVKHGVGVDNIDVAAATNRGILVANAPNTNTQTVADLTVGMILALLRGIVRSVYSARTGGWERVVGHEVASQTVGVIGTGRIGAEVIKRLVPFGPQILGHDVAPNRRLVGEYGLAYVSLEKLLERSDVITLHVPLLPQTRCLIGRPQLALMKDHVMLVNVARGALVDEAALADFLRSHPRAAAAVDVFDVEPPQSSPLLKLENVLPTTHIGGYTYEAMERMDRLCAEAVVAAIDGKPVPNLLNPHAGRERPTR